MDRDELMVYLKGLEPDKKEPGRYEILAKLAGFLMWVEELYEEMSPFTFEEYLTQAGQHRIDDNYVSTSPAVDYCRYAEDMREFLQETDEYEELYADLLLELFKILYPVGSQVFHSPTREIRTVTDVSYSVHSSTGHYCTLKGVTGMVPIGDIYQIGAEAVEAAA
ncbi:MAG: hypothetical protein GY757_10025 [bacterium]|nr:hypothetical protein [bacterium]